MRLACLGVVFSACLLVVDRAAADEGYRVVVHPQEVTVTAGKKVSLRTYLYKGANLEFEWPWKFSLTASAGKIAGHNYIAPAQPGRYRVIVSHRMVTRAASRGTAYVNVRGARPLATLTLTPARLALLPGQAGQFKLTARSRAGSKINYRPLWRATGGTLGAMGRFTAPKKAGKYRVIVEGARGIQATAIVLVGALRTSPRRIVIQPVNPRLSPGQSVQFQAVVRDAAGQAMAGRTLRWTAEGGLISSTGRFTAGDNHGRFSVIARDKDSGLAGRASVRVAPASGSELAIQVRPAKVTLEPGKRISFTPVLTVSGKPIKTWPWEYEYRASAGRFSSNVYTAPDRSGVVRIHIRHRSHKATGEALVMVKAPLHQLLIRPAGKALLPGQVHQFSVTGRDVGGGTVLIQPVWSVSGGVIVAGKFTAGDRPGRYLLSVRDRLTGKTTSVSIEIKPKPVSKPKPRPVIKPKPKPVIKPKPKAAGGVRLVISPARRILQIGQSVDLSASIWRGKEKIWTLPWEFVWRAQAGRFQKNRYTPPARAGTYKITATYKGRGQFSGSAVVVVQPRPPVRLLIAPASVSLLPDQRAQFTARLVDSAGQTVPGRVQWAGAGGVITPAGLYTAGQRVGAFEVIARHARLIGRARVEISLPYQIRLQSRERTVDPGARVAFAPVLYRGAQRLWSRASEYTFLAKRGRFEGHVYIAPLAPGRYQVQVRFKQRARVSATVIVRSPQIFRIVISPGRVELKAGQTQLFRAIAYDPEGRALSWQPIWRATGGQVDRRGVFTAGSKAGKFRVEAMVASGKPRARADVRITSALNYSLTLTPAESRLQPGQTVRFVARLLRAGKPLWADKRDIRFQADGGQFQGTLYRAPDKPGRYRITVRYRKAVSTAWVVVSLGLATKIELFPRAVRLKPGESQSFKAHGRDASGRPVKLDVVWSAQGGKVDRNGQFRAGGVAGTFQIRATDPRSKLFGLATVVIEGRDDFGAMGRKWGASLKSKRKTIHELTDFLIIKVLYAKLSQIKSFRRGFISKYDRGGTALFYTAWYSVLYEFGEYYGREIRRNTSPRRELARFIRNYILRLSGRDRQEFRDGFSAGYKLARGPAVYREIVGLAEAMRKK